MNGVDYAYNALPIADVQNLPLVVYSYSSRAATFHLDASQAPSLSGLLLTDHQTEVVTDLLVSDYAFTAAAGTNNSRFSITAQRVATRNENPGSLLPADSEAPVYSNISGKLMIDHLAEKSAVRIHNSLGQLIFSRDNCNSSLEVPLPQDGVYTLMIRSGVKSWTRKVVISD